MRPAVYVTTSTNTVPRNNYLPRTRKWKVFAVLSSTTSEDGQISIADTDEMTRSMPYVTRGKNWTTSHVCKHIGSDSMSFKLRILNH